MSSHHTTIKTISLADVVKSEFDEESEFLKSNGISLKLPKISSISGLFKIKEETEDTSAIQVKFHSSDVLNRTSIEHIKKENELIIDDKIENQINDIRNEKIYKKRSLKPLESTIKRLKITKSTQSLQNIYERSPIINKNFQRASTSLNCIICKKKFRSDNEIIAHYGSHKKLEKIYCGTCSREVYVNPQYILKNYKMEEFNCLACLGIVKKIESKIPSSGLKNKIDLNSKILIVDKAKKSSLKKVEILCDVCGISVSSNIKLFWHKKAHLESSHFKCPVCREDFTSREAMIDHCKDVHSKSNRVKCEVCKKIFYNVDLKTHMKVHLDAEPENDKLKNEIIIVDLKKEENENHEKIEATLNQTSSQFGYYVKCHYCLELINYKSMAYHRIMHTREKTSKLVERISKRKLQINRVE